MGMRVTSGILGLSMGVLLAIPSVCAADADPTAEAAQAPTSDATHDQILQAIETTRQTDPELAVEMENQLKLLDAGEFAPQAPTTDTGLALGAPQAGPQAVTGRRLADTLPNGGLVGPPVDAGGPVSGGLIGPPTEGGTPHGQDPRFDQVQADPRMQQVREQFEAGNLSEDQAREKIVEVLKDHGIEPNNGHEWDHEGVAGEGTLREGLGHEFERGGFERALEHMAPEAREQMERLSGEHATEGPERYRETFERESLAGAGSQRETESLERTFEGPQLEHSSETPTREYESSTHEYQASDHTYEAPEHDYQAPPREQEYQYHDYQGQPQP